MGSQAKLAKSIAKLRLLKEATVYLLIKRRCTALKNQFALLLTVFNFGIHLYLKNSSGVSTTRTTNTCVRTPILGKFGYCSYVLSYISVFRIQNAGRQ